MMKGHMGALLSEAKETLREQRFKLRVVTALLDHALRELPEEKRYAYDSALFAVACVGTRGTRPHQFKWRDIEVVEP